MIPSRNTSHHKIPENAERVFSGVRTDVYQWNQEMYDGSMSRFEALRFLDASFCIPILPNGNILLTKQEQPGRESFFSLPGGSFDFPLEDPLLCAKRELLEETGFISENWEQWMRYEGTSNVFTYVYYFIARDCQMSQIQNPDPGEKIELFEVNFDDFLLLASDKRFHHHWNLLPTLYEARLFSTKKEALKKILYGV